MEYIARKIDKTQLVRINSVCKTTNNTQIHTYIYKETCIKQYLDIHDMFEKMFFFFFLTH